MTPSVGRIVFVECHQPPPMFGCARCAELEAAIREHKRAIEVAGKFRDDAAAHIKLWAEVGL